MKKLLLVLLLLSFSNKKISAESHVVGDDCSCAAGTERCGVEQASGKLMKCRCTASGLGLWGSCVYQ